MFGLFVVCLLEEGKDSHFLGCSKLCKNVAVYNGVIYRETTLVSVADKTFYPWKRERNLPFCILLLSKHWIILHYIRIEQ